MNQIGHKINQKLRKIEIVLLTQKYLCFLRNWVNFSPFADFFAGCGS